MAVIRKGSMNTDLGFCHWKVTVISTSIMNQHVGMTDDRNRIHAGPHSMSTHHQGIKEFPHQETLRTRTDS